MSAASVSKSFPLPSPSPLKVEDYRFHKEGIVSILDSHSGITTKDSTLRRTLSADMSSNMWLAQNGFSVSAMKRIPSHQDFRRSGSPAAGLPYSSSSIERKEDDYGAENGVGVPNQSGALKDGERTGQTDIWSSILSQTAEDSSKLPPPYVHPLMKRSASSLSEKSLEICTERLGSETGSDRFSSYASSETGDVEDDGEAVQKLHHHQQQQQEKEKDYFQVAKYKKSQPRMFPPPLPSHNCGNGASLQMQSHRKHGRLVLEAVSIPQQNYFHAQRTDGRLVLTLINEENERDKAEEFEQLFDKFEEDELEEEEEADDDDDKEMEFVMEPTPKLIALMMPKFIAISDRNNKWPHRFNKGVNIEGEEEFEKAPLSQSLPPTPRVSLLIPLSARAAAFSLNAYEYFSKTKQHASVSAGIIYPLSTQKCPPFKNTSYCNKAANILRHNSPKRTSFEQKQDLLVTRKNYNKGVLGGCKDSRSSQLSWEACCIATS